MEVQMPDKGVIPGGKDARERSRNEKPDDAAQHTKNQPASRDPKQPVDKDGKIVAGD
jgi:hypothetical protein